jgi:SAM-dependent methyltransferase
MILNVGCGGRPSDRACYFGDVRIDVNRVPSVMILMDAHFLGLKDSIFEKVVCFEVLEHLESPIRALKEFKRVLKEDGEIIISIPNVWYWRRFLRFLIKQNKIFDEKPTTDHKQAWDIYEFHNLAYQLGLRVTDVNWLDWYPKGRLKLGILEPVFRLIPQVCFTHVILKLKRHNGQKHIPNSTILNR